MSRNNEVVRLRTILCLHKFLEIGVTVSEMSRCLGEKPYTVSRIFSDLEKEGLLASDNTRKKLLTPMGKEIVNEYTKKVEILLSFMKQGGIPVEDARKDALFIASICSNKFMEIMESIQNKYKSKAIFKENHLLMGNEFSEVMGNGSIYGQFFIYPKLNKEVFGLDPINYLFEHPCRVIVEDGVGKIQIRISESSIYSKEESINKYIFNHRVQVFNKGYYNDVEQNASVICIPMEVISFQSFGQGLTRVLHGTTSFKITDLTQEDDKGMEYFFTLII